MDPEKGIQPIVHSKGEENQIAMVHNGEIYNFKELLELH